VVAVRREIAVNGGVVSRDPASVVFLTAGQAEDNTQQFDARIDADANG
jgi:hypothetical protein